MPSVDCLATLDMSMNSVPEVGLCIYMGSSFEILSKDISFELSCIIIIFVL